MSSIRDFVPLAKLGEGTFSTVYKVRRLSDQKIYALKKVRLNNLSEKQKENALNEIRILASFECETIVAYKEAFFDDKVNVLCIVMEFADGGDLQKYITTAKKDFRKIQEKVIWAFMKDVLAALAHLHSKGILHRDLKSANIFLHGNKFKLGDLNVSKVNGGSLAYTQTGTPYYASPQVWRDVPYDSKSDIWSFGCILYEMASLSPPFNGKDMDELYRNVQKGYFNPIPHEYSLELSEVISQCLQKNPCNRPSATRLLEHKVICHLTGENQSLVIENSVHNNELLKTIKLPTDLKSLKTNLPESKYEENERKSENKNKNEMRDFLSDRPSFPVQRNNSKVQLDNSSRRKNSNAKVNNSQIFMSPRNNINKSNLYANCRSPEEIMSKKQHYGPIHHSDKKVSQNYSDRITSAKVSSNNQNHAERRPPSAQVGQKSVLIEKYDKFVRQQMNKRPTGIPRTEKRIQAANQVGSEHLVGGPDKQAIEEWRKKLVKKSRILSSNNNYNKPFWMK